MSPPILATKLFIPPTRPGTVLRPRLIERLNEGLNRKLTLISAPAGFGKTTLISEWIAACEQLDPLLRAAWLSLDSGDHDPVRFMTYLVASLQTITPTISAELLSLLQSPQPPPTESCLTALLNDITHIPERVILILDDYHLTDAKLVDDAVSFLVEHLPTHMHLVITTREDPDLPLARLRARGQLTELRAKDLRFSPSEAAEFLNYAMDLGLSAADIAVLETRTEGWIAGLQLAAISIQGQQDAPQFIRTFAGDHRYVVDYLVEEVLERQPDPVRSFLLQTSILDRLNGPLCNAVTGQEEGQARLEALERGNFFVIPLDDRRHWYRYHHLFADVLRAHLMSERPDQVAMLHSRASLWYEQNDQPTEAIHHALAGKDFQRAATLIERALPALRRDRQEATLLNWLQSLPDELFSSRPVLSVHYAGTLLQSGRLDGVETRLGEVERWLCAMEVKGERLDGSLADIVVVDDEELRRLPGSVAMYRAAVALFQGNVADTLKFAGRIPEMVREDDHLHRGAAAGLLALAHWTNGDLEAAREWYIECIARLKRIGHISDALGSSIALADIQMAQGHLRDAISTYERGLQLAEQGTLVLRGAADMHVGLSQLHYERGDLKAAREHLLRSQELGEFAGLPQNPYRWRVAMARIRGAEGDLDGALDLLNEAERLYMGDFSPNVRPISALRTRAWVVQGRLAEAQDWVRQQDLSVEDDLSYLREFEHITLARILLARYRNVRDAQSMPEAVEFLQRLLKSAEDGERTASVIEILVLQALVHQVQGEISAALVTLERALILAEPEHYVRMFVDEGPPMAALLETAAKQGITRDYTRELLRAIDKPEHRSPVIQALTDPLSERELDVLRLLATDLNGPEIARQLMVSLNTLRTHTKNIFTKLDVNSRQSAVRRADELNLI